MSRTTRWVALIVAAQAVFLLSWAGYHEWVRQHAPVILLKCRPVDPQDLLRGDYMILDYNISDVAVPAAPSGVIGNDVWVLLEQRERHHVAVQASRTRLEPKSTQVLVRGKVMHNWRNDRSLERVDYDIGRYYVPEGKGTPRFKTIEVEASVSPTRRLYLKRVLLDGQAYP